ncbi:MAG: CPBP family intramembrane glutamic endopeptidase [Caldilineaceae bacterium]
MQNSAIVQAAVPLDSVQRARRGLALYFAILVPLTALLEGIMIGTGTFTPWVLFLMFTPTVASVTVRLTLREGFGDVSFRLGGRRGVQAILLALILPVIIGLVAYGVAWSLGLADFTPPASATFPAVTNPLARLGLQFVSVLSIGILIDLVLAAGEEIGWRGYMLTRLIEARIPQPVLVSGLIWGAWHLPLIFGGLYAVGPNPLLSGFWLMIAFTVGSFLYAKLRLAIGSIWPAVMLHGAWNSTIQGVFDVSTSGEQATLWVGESGILVMLAIIVVVILLARTWRPNAGLPQSVA